MVDGNLIAGAAAPRSGETFLELLKHRNLLVERIVSSARTTPQCYVQAQDEWVVLLQGEATMDIDGRTETLQSGDYVFLPAGTPHTVQSTSEGALWLAIHLYPDGER
jgi:cupin 2 domain-containing protein